MAGHKVRVAAAGGAGGCKDIKAPSSGIARNDSNEVKVGIPRDGSRNTTKVIGRSRPVVAFVAFAGKEEREGSKWRARGLFFCGQVRG